MAGGRGSIPGIGTAGYLTSYARVSNLPWEEALPERKYLYQNPATILIDASNGASDFGNKFGQPLIAGTVTTFEHKKNDLFLGWDKVIMLAGGIGHANREHVNKEKPKKGDVVILLGGDNYRIGIGGGAISSVNTGEFSEKLEINAVQRSNPEMQQRVYRVVRALTEQAHNPIVSIHDHGAGGHFNCLSELLSESGGIIFMDKLPIGDLTLSDMEILGNESQERMAMVVPTSSVNMIKDIAKREHCPCFVIGECTGDGKLIFKYNNGIKPIDLDFDFLFGKTPKTEINASPYPFKLSKIKMPNEKIEIQLKKVLRLTKIASKEWLTHKVDRSVSGLVAQQQTVGLCQIPLSDIAVKSMDYTGKYGIALGIGDRPIPGIINPEACAGLSIGEALLNIIWAPLADGLRGISLSANWMWPCHQLDENLRLYKAVSALSNICIELEIPVPTGKDSLSMTQKYPNGLIVKAPGTVIITATSLCNNVNKTVTPDIKKYNNTTLLYIPFQEFPSSPDNFLGTSSLAQVYNQLGGEIEHVPDLKNPKYFKLAFNFIQKLIHEDVILAGHDISDGGIITALCEMAFAGNCGLKINLAENAFFYEGLGVIIQIKNSTMEQITTTLPKEMQIFEVAQPDLISNRIEKNNILDCDMSHLRRIWQKTSYDMELLQMDEKVAKEGFDNFDLPLEEFRFPIDFNPQKSEIFHKNVSDKINAAIIREKGTNGDREMAYCLDYAGFRVRDVTMTDITSGRETLDDINFIVFCGGFSNSDVLGSARGWAGIFRYNANASKTLSNYYKRSDTLSLGICNGCQLMILLNLLYPKHSKNKQPEMLFNKSKIFESRFISVKILKTSSVLFQGMEGSLLGIWVAHAEGRFSLGSEQKKYSIPLVY